jgi:uncharacterized repeat protein (TIGR03803 family)
MIWREARQPNKNNEETRKRAMTRRALVAVQAALAIIVLALSLVPVATADVAITVLYTFTGGADGGAGGSALTPDGSGNLFGTTVVGGQYGLGTVFELMPNGSGGWTYNVLYSFGGGADGSYPINRAGLSFDSQGNLYGSSSGGGTYGDGAVWELSKGSNGTWSMGILWNFQGTQGMDGASPEASVLLDAAGNVYGTTAEGGQEYGVVYKLTPAGSGWRETILHTFTGGNDGYAPEASLVWDHAGNLYGTTMFGGAYQQGVVFKLHNTGSNWVETVLYSFTGNSDGSDGSLPQGNLAFDNVGRLYGTTEHTTPNNGGYGGVFRLAPAPTAPLTAQQPWQITWLHHFSGTDGAYPYSGVIFDNSGNLYSVTFNGGQSQNCRGGCGVAFELSPSQQGWTETVLYNFTNGSDGSQPLGNLLLGNGGILYGTTPGGGSDGYGTVYQLTQ